MFYEPSCVIIGVIQNVTRNIMDDISNRNLGYIVEDKSAIVELWKSETQSLKLDIRIPEIYKDKIYLAGIETGRLGIDPYGESQIICSNLGKKLPVINRNKNSRFVVSKEKKLTSITCATTAGGCEISIYEFYLGQKLDTFFVSFKEILSLTIDKFEPEKFGKYKDAVQASILRAQCYKCSHIHFGEE